MVRRVQGSATRTSHLRCDLHKTAFCRGRGRALSQCKRERGEPSCPIPSRRKCGRGEPIVEHAPGASRVSVRTWDGVHPVLLRCCCTADAAVGGGELCPSADVRGVSPVARQLWAGASPVPSQISASGKVPAGKVRAAALAPACHSRPSLALPAATNSMRRCVQSRCRCGRDEPSPCADESRGAPSHGADGYQEGWGEPIPNPGAREGGVEQSRCSACYSQAYHDCSPQ